MKKHVRLQGKKFSFRLRVLDRYVDAQETWDTEEEAAFFADVAKHYLRLTYRVDLDPSLDGDLFAALAYRRNISLSDCLDAVPPGVRTFIVLNEEALEAIPSPELRDWEKLRGHDNPEIRDWVYKCEVASLRAEEYARVSGESIFLRLSTVDKSLDASLKSLALAVRLHGEPVPAALEPRVSDLSRLIKNLMETQDYVRELATRLRREQSDASSALQTLEANRPPLT